MSVSRATNIPVAVAVIRGSSENRRQHAYAHAEELLLVSPRAQAPDLQDTANFPNFLSSGSALTSIVEGVTQLLLRLNFKRITILRSNSTSWGKSFGDVMEEQARKAGVVAQVIECDSSARLKSVDWSVVGSFSPVLVVTAYSDRMSWCLRSVAASGVAVFQLVVPYLTDALSSPRFGFHDRDARLLRLVNGTLGVSPPTGLNAGSRRTPDFLERWGPSASTISQGAMEIYDTIHAIGEGLTSCLKTGRWYARGVGGRGMKLTAAELKGCLQKMPASEGLQGDMVFDPFSNGAFNNRGFDVDNYVVRTDSSVEDGVSKTVTNVGVVDGARIRFAVCPTTKVTGENFEGNVQLGGSSCSDAMTAPVLVAAHPVNESTIIVKWARLKLHQHTQDSALVGFAVTLSENLGDTSTVVRQHVKPDQQQIAIAVDQPAVAVEVGSFGEGDGSGGTSTRRGALYRVQVRALYEGQRDDAAVSTGSFAVCVAHRGGSNTCECSDAQFNSLGQPDVAPKNWRCLSCPLGVTCSGRVWPMIRSQPGYFLALPSCAKSSGRFSGESVTTKADAMRCIADLRVVRCLAGPKGCPGNLTSGRVLDTLKSMGSGWINTSHSFQCANGYDGFGCTACKDGFALDEKNYSCNFCPEAEVAMTSAIMFGVTLGAVLLVVALIAARQAIRRRAPLRSRLRRFLVTSYRRGGVNEIHELFTGIDGDGSGSLSRSEFIIFLSHLGDMKKDIKNSTSMTTADFRRTVSFNSSEQHDNKVHIGTTSEDDSFEFTHKECDVLFAEIDQNANGEIDFEEILEFITADHSGGHHRALGLRQILYYVKWLVRNKRVKEVIKLTLRYLQVLNSISANFPELKPIISTRLTYLDSMDAAVSPAVDFDLSSSFALRCFFSPRFISNLVRSTLGPMLAIVGLQVVVMVLGRAANKPRTTRAAAQHFKGVGQLMADIAAKVLFVTYPSTSRTILRTFHCTAGDDSSDRSTTAKSESEGDYGAWMTADSTVACRSGDPDVSSVYEYRILPFAASMVLLFSLGVPAAMFVALRSKRYPVNILHDINRDGSRTPSSVSSGNLRRFYASFSPSFWWFGPADLLRHFFITAFVGVVYVGGQGGSRAFGAASVQGRLIVGLLFVTMFFVFFLSFPVYGTSAGSRLQRLCHFST